MGEVVGIFASESIDMADIQAYWEVVRDSFAIHSDKERQRHALWKKYPARDQLNMIKVKTERALHAYDYSTSEGNDIVIAEVPDIINYAVFARRIAQGKL
jgi:hypothetical protein